MVKRAEELSICVLDTSIPREKLLDFFPPKCYNNKWKSKGGTHCDLLDSQIVFDDSGKLSDHGALSAPDFLWEKESEILPVEAVAWNRQRPFLRTSL